jgi:hypothetical protein
MDIDRVVLAPVSTDSADMLELIGSPRPPASA